MGENELMRRIRETSIATPARLACWGHGKRKPDDERKINLKMFFVFGCVKLFPYERIIFQFWRPLLLPDTRRLVLECSRTPFALPFHNRPLHDVYRPHSIRYQYSIDDGVDDEPPWIITGGLAASAFRNRFPEVLLDMTLHQGSPLIDCALKCELACCVMLPVFERGASSECLGVVECSVKHPAHLLPIFNEMARLLEIMGLEIYLPQGTWPYKQAIIPADLEPVKVEIEKGLKTACVSHGLFLAQVWISYECENDHQLKLAKLSGYSLDSDVPPSLKAFYNKFDVIPLKSGEGLVSKALLTRQPHICRNISKMTGDRGVLALLSASTKCTSLVICLRSTRTAELDYAFEFFWPCSRDPLILLESLLSTLRKHLPSFKLPSGEQLDGDEQLYVVDVDNSSPGGPVKFLQGSESTQAPEASNETRTSVGVKRKFIAGQSELNWYRLTNINNLEDDDDEDEGDQPILAAYRNQYSLFYLPSSSTFENVMGKLNKEFQLDPARTYKVEYQASRTGQLSSLVCLKSCRRRDDMGLIQLHVRPHGADAGWRWTTNS